MGFPVWYATVTALHVNGVWVDRISFPLDSKPVVELALLPSRQYAYVLDEKRVLPVGPYAVDFVKEVLGDQCEYHYHLDSNIPSLSEVLASWGADEYTILRLEAISEVLGFMFGNGDS